MFNLFDKDLDYSTRIVIAVNHDLNSMSQEEIIDLLSDTLIKILINDPYLAALQVLGYDPDDYEYDDEKRATKAYDVHKVLRDFVSTELAREIMRYIVNNVYAERNYDLRRNSDRSHVARYSVYRFFEVFRTMHGIKKEVKNEANC